MQVGRIRCFSSAVDCFFTDGLIGKSDHVQIDDPLIQRTIAYYQAASHGFKAQLLSWNSDQ
jgi:hypothetical protein